MVPLYLQYQLYLSTKYLSLYVLNFGTDSIFYIASSFYCYNTEVQFYELVTGFILRKKPLYVAIAQRKEERQMQLQVLYGQRVAGLSGPPSPVIPGGYSPLYYPTPGVVSPQPNLIYQQAGIRPGWRPNAIPNPSRPLLHPAPVTLVSFLVSVSTVF